MAKLAHISDAEAERALERYQSLEENKPDAAQLARYAGIGAASGPIVGILGNALKGKDLVEAATKAVSGNPSAPKVPVRFGKTRAIASDVLRGAITAGLIPVIRHHADHAATKHELKKYLQEHADQKAPEFQKSAGFPTPPSLHQQAGGPKPPTFEKIDEDREPTALNQGAQFYSGPKHNEGPLGYKMDRFKLAYDQVLYSAFLDELNKLAAPVGVPLQAPRPGGNVLFGKNSGPTVTPGLNLRGASGPVAAPAAAKQPPPSPFGRIRNINPMFQAQPTQWSPNRPM